MNSHYPSRRTAKEYEKSQSDRWENNNIFSKSIAGKEQANNFVFYDGPPFLTGKPHHGHLLVSAVKDSIARYQSMLGKRVDRRWGWDCHGLPAEVFVEKKLGIANKKEIGTKISIPDYVKECRSAMVKTGTEWEDVIKRIGRWVEFKGAYRTMDKEYMESVWWAFKQLHDDGKIFQGERVLVYCTRDATPISKSEVAMEDSYKKITDPSVYVFFKLEGREEYMLAWTTTPWTLPANVALAVNPSVDYVLVDYEGKKFYLAKDALERVMVDDKNKPLSYKVKSTVKGKSLISLRYEPIFENRGETAHRVLSATFVDSSSGTGIVHEAPAYGEEDYDLCKKEGFPLVSVVDENGNYTEGRWVGESIWDSNKQIAKTLRDEGTVFKIEYIEHDYPHCHRCGGKLMYRAHPSWFMDITSQKQQMIDQNNEINWIPGHLKQGRFNYILESAPDWNISRDRYWATPLPVWVGQKSDGTEVIKVVGSYQELEKLTGKLLDDYHLPSVMDLKMEIDGVELHHVGKVLDCWFESGSMPFAQFHYPFENVDKFKQNFPADFISEAIDQTRGWFYSMLAVNVGIFGVSPYKNVICTGLINAADGKKLSKKLGNYTDPLELMDNYSADAFRFLMLSSPLTNGENFSLSDRDVADASRKLRMVWNMYDFFTMYANVDGWHWVGKYEDPSSDLSNKLDVWVVSRLHEVVEEMTLAMNAYSLQGALRPLLPFIDDVSNWYIRRSRRRFWKTEDSKDKNDAYTTLHYVMLTLSHLLAPFAPFMADELFGNLTQGTLGESVHLRNWPIAGTIDNETVKHMGYSRDVVKRGLSLRAQNQVKVRQPLQSVIVSGSSGAPDDYADIIKQELNVKEVLFEENDDGEDNVSLDFTITRELELEGVSKEVIRQIQSFRRKLDLEVDERIKLSLVSGDENILESIKQHSQDIKKETLAVSIESSDPYSQNTDVILNTYRLNIGIEKSTD